MSNDQPRDAWENTPSLDRLKAYDIWSLRRNFLADLWPKVDGWRVLEVGSGPAHDSLVFAERGAQVTALDYSRTGLELAQTFYRNLGLPLRTACASATSLPFADDSFDVAFNAGVLEHFTDEALQQVLDEMIRVVRPGGYVLAFCPNRYNVFYQTHLRRVSEHSYEFERAFTASELVDRLEARGLRQVHRSGVHVHPSPNYLLPSWLPKHHRIEPWCRLACAPFERTRRFHRIKSLLAQDFVVWAQVPEKLGPRRPIGDWGGGPAVRNQRLAA